MQTFQINAVIRFLTSSTCLELRNACKSCLPDDESIKFEICRRCQKSN